MYRFFWKWYSPVAAVIVALTLSGQIQAETRDAGDFARDFTQALSRDWHCRIPDPRGAESQAASLESLYGDRTRQALWTDPQRYDALLAALEDLYWDGLNPEVYALDRLADWRESAEGEDLACRDLLASTAYLAALHHLRQGFLDRTELAPLWRRDEADDNPPHAMSGEAHGRDAREGLANIANAFDRARPKSAAYRQLRAAYGEWLRQHRHSHWPPVPDGPLLRPGMEDERVSVLRRRLDPQPAADTVTESDLARDGNHYGEDLVEAVRAFQASHRLQVDGVVGPETLAALNRSPGFREDQLRINLERMRWLERELSPTLLLVDIAGARATLTRDGQLAWQGRVQVGTARRQTPALKSAVTHLTFNPTWTVPPTIYRQDKLPEIRRDIGYLADNRLRVLDRDGRELNPAAIDWRNPGAVVLRQDPGPGNALGLVAIRFPNPFSVYLHDTPSQRNFASHRRTYSSGCVRVEGARELADQLFAGASRETRDAIAAARESGQTRNIRLPETVPIVMDYWTATADGTGRVEFRPDVYGQDEKLIAALREREARLRDVSRPQ